MSNGNEKVWEGKITMDMREIDKIDIFHRNIHTDAKTAIRSLIVWNLLSIKEVMYFLYYCVLETKVA